MYKVIDRHTGITVGTYATLKAARRTADRKDLQYGAIRYMVQRASAVE